MSARTDLIAALSQALPDTRYRVSDRATTPDQIDRGTVALRVFASTVTPAQTTQGLAVEMTVWACSPLLDPSAADADLDLVLGDVLRALLALPWVQFDRADRDVMPGNEGPRWHGYRFTVTAFATITKE